MRGGGIFLSLIGHGLILFWGFFVLEWAPPEQLYAPPPSIPVELVTVAPVTNVKAAAPEPPKPEPEPPKPEPPEPEPEPEPPPPEPEPEPAPPEPEPEPPPPEPEPEPPPPAPEPQPEPPKPEPAKVEPPAAPRKKPPPPKKKPEGLASLDLDKLKDLAKKAQSDPRDPSLTPDRSDTIRSAAGKGTELTVSEVDAMKLHLAGCWRIPLDAPNPDSLVVRVRIKLNPDGRLSAPPELLDRARISLLGDSYLQAAADEASRAVIACEPYSFLPAERYSAWKEFVITFDPSQPFNR